MKAYLDHNATSPMRAEVLEVMDACRETAFGNPSSVHRFGQNARAVVDTARREVSSLINGGNGSVVFTGSGTEAVVLAMTGHGRPFADQGYHAVVSAIEHASGLDAARELERRDWELTFIPPEPSGRISEERIAEAMLPQTRLVSVMHANNETGVIQPVEAIAKICRDSGVVFHVDAVQSVGKVPIDVSAWDVDLLSMAGHKMGGPQGVGALWKRRELTLEPRIPGSQESGLRGGTHAVNAIAGFGEAARLAGKDLATHQHDLTPLRERLERAVIDRVSSGRVTGGQVPRLPNTAHFTFDAFRGGDLVVALDLAGYAVSSGSACLSGSEAPSHVLLAMGMPEDRARTAVRVSLGRGNTVQDVDGFVDALSRVVVERGVRVEAGR